MTKMAVKLTPLFYSLVTLPRQGFDRIQDLGKAVKVETMTLLNNYKLQVQHFSQKRTGRCTAVKLCTYGDRLGIDRCTYSVCTGAVCSYAAKT